MEMVWLVLGIIAALVGGVNYGMLLGARKVVESAGGEQMQVEQWAHSGQVKGKEEVIRWLLSPVSGEVVHVQSGEELLLLFRPVDGYLYAPWDGRVTKVYPFGNALDLESGYGAQIYLQLGEDMAEGERYLFRPKVVGREVVGSGKKLLEFERKILEEKGRDILLTMKIRFPAQTQYQLSVKEGDAINHGNSILVLKEFTH